MNKQEILETLREKFASTLMSTLSIEITDWDGEKLTGQMPVCEQTRQAHGFLHGGASAAFMETLGSVAATLQVRYPEERCVGAELNVSHLRTVRSGMIRGVATPCKIGRTLQVWDIRLTNEEGQLISVGRLTTALLQTPPNKERE